MNRFTVTITYHYDVDNETLVRDYDTIDLDEAALIDERNMENMHYTIGEDINCGLAQNVQVHVKAERLD